MAVQGTSRKKQNEAKAALEQGHAAWAAGDGPGAVRAFSQAAQLAPKSATAREALAIALLRQGEAAQALSVLFSCLALRPLAASTVRLLCAALTLHPVRSMQGVQHRDLSAALALDGVAAQPLVSMTLRHLAGEGALADAIQIGRGTGWPAAAEAYLSTGGQKPTPEDELFHRCLARGFVDDPEIELLLTQIRRHLLLDGGASALRLPRLGALAVALMRQCQRNEFVWFADAAEQDAAASLEVDLPALSEGSHDATYGVVLHAMYEPLEHLLGGDTDVRQLKAVRPREAGAFAAEVVSEARAIEAKAAAIPSIGTTSDAVSQAVTAQYEENPYPRWIESNPIESGALRPALARLLPGGKWPFEDQSETVLIAGCGTGREAAMTFDGFGGSAKVTAIDLSRASLGYAAMKAEQQDAKIEFIQMDILNLPELGRTFDVIRSGGVLHHMDDPMAGWEMLCRHLNPGGIMNVALYSAIARASFDRFATDGAPGPGASGEAIRAYRFKFLAEAAPGERFSEDFWNLSGCRDMLFHAKEHRFTLLEIEAALARVGLEFLGFFFSPEEAARIERHEPGLIRSDDFARWHAFEQAHPETFIDMYQFWCRKPAD